MSPPEHVADRVARRRILATLFRDGGCVHCIHRVEAWGQTICSGHAGRSWPLCSKDGNAPEFSMDETTFKGSER